MPKVLIEIKNGTVMNVETTSDDVEVYVVDHDVINNGSVGELKRYLADADGPSTAWFSTTNSQSGWMMWSPKEKPSPGTWSNHGKMMRGMKQATFVP